MSENPKSSSQTHGSPSSTSQILRLPMRYHTWLPMHTILVFSVSISASRFKSYGRDRSSTVLQLIAGLKLVKLRTTQRRACPRRCFQRLIFKSVVCGQPICPCSMSPGITQLTLDVRATRRQGKSKLSLFRWRFKATWLVSPVLEAFFSYRATLPSFGFLYIVVTL